MARETRDGHPCFGEQHPLPVLVPRGRCGPHGVAAQPQPRRDGGRDHGRVVVHADDTVHGHSLGERPGLGRRLVGALEVESQQAVGLGLREGAGPLGSDRQVDTDPAGRLHKCRRPIRGGGQEQQQALGVGQITSWRRRSRGSSLPRDP